MRMEMLPQYKAQRPPMDNDLRQQFPMVKKLLEVIRVPIVEAEGWEGDDILWARSRAAARPPAATCCSSPATGYTQLVTDHINVVSTRKGLSDIAIMTPESVESLYQWRSRPSWCRTSTAS